MKRNYCIGVLVALILLIPVTAEAASPPRTIFYQGRLTNDTGVPLDGTFNFDFRIYDAETGGNQLWPSSGSESHSGVSVTRGVYSVYLGTNTALPDDVFDTKAWLEVDVDGTTFSPRTEFSATPYAFNAYRLDGRNSGDYRQDLSQVLSVGNSAGSNNVDMSGQKILLNGGWVSGDGDTALTVDSLGAVGINTSFPVGKLHILGKNVQPALDTAPLVLQETGDNDRMFLGGDEIDAPSSDGGLFLQNNNTGDIYMATGGGSVGIDTNSPVAPLDIGDQGYIAIHHNQDYFLGGGKTPDAQTSGLHLEANSNPSAGDPLFTVESSGSRERLVVEHSGAIRGKSNLDIDGLPFGGSTIHDAAGVNLSDSAFIDDHAIVSDTVFLGGTDFWRPLVEKDNEGDGAAWLNLEAGGGMNMVVDRDGNDGSSDDFQIWGDENPSGQLLMHVDNNGDVGVGTSSPAAKLDVQGELSVQGQTSTPTASNTIMGFQHVQQGSSGIFFEHPTASVTIEYDPATPQLILDNNTGNDWNLGAMVIQENGTVNNNNDDDFNGTGFTVAMEVDGNKIQIVAVREGSDGPGFIFNGTAENNNANSIQGLVQYWK